MSDKTHLVTGAAGLVGRALLAQLTARGDRVIALDQTATEVAGLAVQRCDLGDVHRLYRLIADGLPSRDSLDGVFHCGAISGPMLGRDNPALLCAVNVTGTINILEAARLFRARRFLNCSSVSAYGPTGPGLVQETSALSPSTVYGASKLASEALVTAYAREGHIDAASFRLSWVYGPDRSTPCLLGDMLRDLVAGRATARAWGHDFPRQYIHADDAAAGMIAALDAKALGQPVYNLTGGDFRSLGALAALLREIAPEAQISLGPGPDPGDDLQQEFDISAARHQLGYQPAVSLEAGIRRFLTTLRQSSGAQL